MGTNKNPDMRKDPDSFPYNGVTNVDTYVTRSIETKGNGYVQPFKPLLAIDVNNCSGIPIINQPRLSRCHVFNAKAK